MNKLKINPQVYEDLLEIRNYIAEDSVGEANKVTNEILAKIESLSDFPDRGAKLSSRIRFDVKHRYVLVYSFAIVYYVEDDCIIVTTILHMSRDFEAIKLD